MSLQLPGRIILITGGADGIGRECALAYAKEGASVAIADVQGARAVELAGEIGANAVGLECDVSAGPSVEAAVRATVERFGRLPHLMRASITELEQVEGVGQMRARQVKEGLARLAEASIFERYQ